MPVAWGRVLSLHWEERETAIPEATLEVEHPNGDRQFFVIPITRMTDRITGQMKKRSDRADASAD
jgi:hypothetical protein